MHHLNYREKIPPPPTRQDFDQASQVAESAIQCMSMNADWVYHNLNTNKKPCVVDPKTGQLEFYVPTGKSYTYCGMYMWRRAAHQASQVGQKACNFM